MTMEIERKWTVKDWPQKDLPLLFEQNMRQGYLVVHPTVRIREESTVGGATQYILCLKAGEGIVRREIEMAIPKEKFEEIEEMIGKPLIPKVRRTYELSGGLHLEVNHVDRGLPTEFWYAEIEFQTEEEARSFDPSTVGLADYLNDDVSEQPGQTMGAYWEKTRK